jgi:flagellar biosynthesis protein FlhG
MVSSASALAATENVIQPQRPTKPVQVLAVTGGKGGVGKSNIAVNLALELGKLERSVMVMDADLGLANIDVLCALSPAGTLEDVFAGKRSLDDILLQIDRRVSLLPASSGAPAITSLSQAEYGGLIQAFNSLQAPIDTLVIDTPAGISDQVTSFCRAAREVLVVVCDEPTSITDAYSMIKVLNRDFNVKRFNVVVNKVTSNQQGIDLFNKILKVADNNLNVMLNFLGSVPQDDYMQQSVQVRKPVVDSFPRSKSALALKKLAKKIHGWPEPKQPIGHVEFFVERLVSYSTHAGVIE